MQVVASFIKTATFIMILGAAIMVLGGGKYVKEALKFGVGLGVFILLCRITRIEEYKEMMNMIKPMLKKIK